jgi:hypothetical protein
VPTQNTFAQYWQGSSIPDYRYEYSVTDPVTKGTYLLRTQRPKIREQIEFHIRLAIAESRRVPAGEKTVLYAT